MKLAIVDVVRRHAAFPDSTSWAELGIKVPEARELVAHVDSLTKVNAELIAALDDTRARMRAAEAVVSAANTWADAWDHCMTKGDEEENASVFHAAENALLIALRPGQEA